MQRKKLRLKYFPSLHKLCAWTRFEGKWMMQYMSDGVVPDRAIPKAKEMCELFARRYEQMV